MTAEAIADRFHGFYTRLYNLPPQHRHPDMAVDRMQVINDYLTKSGLPNLSESDAALLEEPITSQEIDIAITQLKSGKSPGPDGYWAVYYKTFSDLLKGPLRDALNSLSTPRNVTPDLLSAHITVLAKPGKDPTDCASYRPISLLNLDLKLFAKILATRLNPLLPGIVGLEQAGFVPGREAKDNTSKALLLLHAARTRDIEGLLLSTDAEKAFDRVAWDFMLAVCRHVGLGPHMLSWIAALYQNPTAQLRINGTLSKKVEIANGTRQGCPLSPLLFILTLEPFIRTIKLNPTVSGFRVGDSEYKIAAYADDLLFFLTDPHFSLPSLLSEFSRYGYISNLKINYTKSEALNVTLPEKVLALAKANSPFRWDPDTLKYLGIWLTPHLSKIFEKNFPPLLKGCEADLRQWDQGNFSWLGRASIVKMVILPKFPYLMRTLPVKVPQSFFSSLNSTLLRFLWNPKKTRIKLTSLMKTKESGGLGFPDFRSYYRASHLARIVDWHCQGSMKEWVSLEAELCPIALHHSPWTPTSAYPTSLRRNPITGPTLEIFQFLAKKLKISSVPGPLTPLADNPDFTPGVNNTSLRSSPQSDPLLVGECYVRNKLKDWQALKSENNLPRLRLWTYFQLRSYVHKLRPLSNLTRPLTEMESVCRSHAPLAKATSVVYSWLQRDREGEPDGHRRRWSEDLGVDIPERRWRYACIMTHKCSNSSRLQETGYKLLTHWYNTPDRLHKWDPQRSQICWRCQRDKGTLFHIWWSCPMIAIYWGKVKGTIKQITETKLVLDVACCLLHLSSFSLTRYKKSLTKHLLNAAKSLIPLYWNSSRVPSVSEWLHRVKHVYEMEDTLAQDRGTAVNFHDTWQTWLMFRYSREYDELRLLTNSDGAD